MFNEKYKITEQKNVTLNHMTQLGKLCMSVGKTIGLTDCICNSIGVISQRAYQLAERGVYPSYPKYVLEKRSIDLVKFRLGKINT